jgi:hypothetical protein
MLGPLLRWMPIVKWFESGKFKPMVRMGRIIDELGLDEVKKIIAI